jgi:hydroxypyruvate isomerase
MLKQSFTWWSFGSNQTPDVFLKAAAKIGYSAVELIDETLFPQVKKAGLEISAHRGHGTIERGLNRQEEHERIYKELATSLQLAETWKIPNLICFSGNRKGLSDAEGAEISAEGLRRVAPLAESAGVTLVLELLNSKVDHADYQCDNTPWGVKVVELVNSPNVKLLYDIYHMQIMEGDLIRTVQHHHQHIGHYHTAGNPGRHELNEAQEINYSPIFRAIRDTLYTGYITHEFIPIGEATIALQEAFEMCLKSLS